jgi:hypothetical protein
MAASGRTVSAGRDDARNRLRTAQAYLEVADLVLGERDRAEMPAVAAGLAVLAGIAASDAICAIRLQSVHRGQDHRGAADLLEGATPDGKKLAITLLRLLDVKDAAHYGVVVVTHQKAREATKRADLLVDRARDEIER